MLILLIIAMFALRANSTNTLVINEESPPLIHQDVFNSDIDTAVIAINKLGFDREKVEEKKKWVVLIFSLLENKHCSHFNKVDGTEIKCRTTSIILNYEKSKQVLDIGLTTHINSFIIIKKAIKSNKIRDGDSFTNNYKR